MNKNIFETVLHFISSPHVSTTMIVGTDIILQEFNFQPKRNLCG